MYVHIHIHMNVLRCVAATSNYTNNIHTNSNRRDAPSLAKRCFFMHKCVYLFMYVYVYVYAYVCVCTCTRLQDTHWRIKRCFFIFGCIFSFFYVYVYPYVYVCIRRDIHTHKRMKKYIFFHSFMCMYIHENPYLYDGETHLF